MTLLADKETWLFAGVNCGSGLAIQILEKLTLLAFFQGHIKLPHESKTIYYIAWSNFYRQTTAMNSQVEVVAFGGIAETLVGITANELVKLKNLVTAHSAYIIVSITS